MGKKEKNEKTQKKKITSKQIVALAGVAALVLLYLITLVAAIADTSESGNWFRISLSATVVGIAVTIIGLDALPTKNTPYTAGMNVVVIVLFCVIPMCAWALTLWAMKGYELDGERVKTIQAVNGARKEAVARGMSQEEAMRTITDETVRASK